MALRRFIARRGRANIIYTDCGSIFQGTAHLLKEIWEEVEAANAVNTPPIRWRFSPPRAPWWGGWWERLMKERMFTVEPREGKSTDEGKPKVVLNSDILDKTPLTATRHGRTIKVPQRFWIEVFHQLLRIVYFVCCFIL